MGIPAKDALVALAKRIAQNFKLDPTLVCAVVEQESAWNPFAVRYEPKFMTDYVGPLYVNNRINATEAYTRSMSWGLMQVMGQVAREKGVTLKFLPGLCDPEAGLSIGCRKLADCLELAKGDVKKALQSYNGGGDPDYADEVMARQATYK